MRSLLALATIPLLAACVSAPDYTVPSSRPASTAPVPPQQPQIEPQTGFRAPRIMSAPGIDGVIGTDANGLVRQFGTPRLDVWEGDGRKLQFSGSACVLDIYLYPTAPGRGETATWVEARRGTDGRDVDRAACIAALRRR